MLTVKEVAAYLNLNERTVLKLAAEDLTRASAAFDGLAPVG